MKRKIAVSAFVLASAAACQTVPGDAVDPADVELGAALSGANEVNAAGERNQGAAHGSGRFSGWLSPAKGRLCYTLTWQTIETPTAAHIHSGAIGKNGPVFIALPHLGPGDRCIDVGRDKAATVAARPGEFYVNLHNPTFPAGALRGQLVVPAAN